MTKLTVERKLIFKTVKLAKRKTDIQFSKFITKMTGKKI